MTKIISDILKQFFSNSFFSMVSYTKPFVKKKPYVLQYQLKNNNFVKVLIKEEEEKDRIE
ncbi:hypothetical protein BLOT_010115 [Blomia tropicalis]|nr:hypothetical protein BLOT_010115 [Blomia tropicalis]